MQPLSGREINQLEPMTARLVKPSVRRVPSETQSVTIAGRGQAPVHSAQTRRTNGNEMATAGEP